MLSLSLILSLSIKSMFKLSLVLTLMMSLTMSLSLMLLLLSFALSLSFTATLAMEPYLYCRCRQSCRYCSYFRWHHSSYSHRCRSHSRSLWSLTFIVAVAHILVDIRAIVVVHSRAHYGVFPLLRHLTTSLSLILS